MQIEVVSLLPRFAYLLIFEINLRSEAIIKTFGPLLFEVQFYKEVALHHIADLGPIFLVNICLQLGLNSFVQVFVQAKQDSLLFGDNCRMVRFIECLAHYYFVSLFFVNFISFSILNTSYKHYSHEWHLFVLVMNYLVGLVFLSFYFC